MTLPQVQTRSAAVRWKQKLYLILKRGLDLTVALSGLVLFSPFLALIVLMIRLDSPGPALFTQTRIGEGGRPFWMFKFRTLKQTLDRSTHRAFMFAFVKGEISKSERGQVIYKPFDKSVVTRVGRFLRRTSLDELPQLINVVIGDMSLVGPRPNVLWEVKAYKEWHKERLSVLPGLTGLAQVNGRSGLEFDVIVKYDIEYVRQQSLRLDLQIIWRTVLLVLTGRGAQ